MLNSLYSFLKETSTKELILFGAGRASTKEMEKLMVLYPDISIVAIVDNNEKICGEFINGIEIKSIEWLKEQRNTEKVILITTSLYTKEIVKQLEELELGMPFFSLPFVIAPTDSAELKKEYRLYRRCVELYTGLLEKEQIIERYRKMKQGEYLVIPRMPVMITTRCTLRCKDCSNLIPCYKKPKDYDSEEVIQWIDNLLEAIDELIVLELVGGEPFLHKDLHKILDYVIKHEKIIKVEFTSNGMVVPTEEIISLLKSPKVRLHISDYGKINNYDKMIEVLDEEGIEYNIYEDMVWVDCGDTSKKNRTMNVLQKQYMNCNMSMMCRTLLNGRLYACSRAASLTEIGLTNEVEYVDLCDKDNLRGRIVEFMHMDYSMACDYCDFGTDKCIKIEAGIQLT